MFGEICGGDLKSLARGFGSVGEGLLGGRDGSGVERVNQLLEDNGVKLGLESGLGGDG